MSNETRLGPGTTDDRGVEAGFTIAEVLIAILVLVFGMMAVTNLMVLATTSNTVASHNTASATVSSEVMERLKALPFTNLTAGGNLDADVGTTDCVDALPGTDCVRSNNFNVMKTVPGVGRLKTRWRIESVDTQTRFIVVRTETQSRLTGRRSRTEFTTFRSCTNSASGCPT